MFHPEHLDSKKKTRSNISRSAWLVASAAGLTTSPTSGIDIKSDVTSPAVAVSDRKEATEFRLGPSETSMGGQITAINDPRAKTYSWAPELNTGFPWARFYPLQEQSEFTVADDSVALFQDRIAKGQGSPWNAASTSIRNKTLSKQMYDTVSTDWSHPFVVIRLVTGSQLPKGKEVELSKRPVNLRVSVGLKDGSTKIQRMALAVFAQATFLPLNWSFIWDVLGHLAQVCDFNTSEMIPPSQLKQLGLPGDHSLTWEQLIGACMDQCNPRPSCGLSDPPSFDEFGRLRPRNLYCPTLASTLEDPTAPDIKPLPACFVNNGYFTLPEAPIIMKDGCALFHGQKFSNAFFTALQNGRSIVIENSHPAFRDLLDATTLEYIANEWKVRTWYRRQKKNEVSMRRPRSLGAPLRYRAKPKRSYRNRRRKQQLPEEVVDWLITLWQSISQLSMCTGCVFRDQAAMTSLPPENAPQDNTPCTFLNSYRPGGKSVNPWHETHPLRPGILRKSLNVMDETFYPDHHLRAEVLPLDGSNAFQIKLAPWGQEDDMDGKGRVVKKSIDKVFDAVNADNLKETFVQSDAIRTVCDDREAKASSVIALTPGIGGIGHSGAKGMKK